MLEEIATALTPLILQGAAALLTILLAWATLTLKRKLGLDIEARHREALHSAIMSGVQAALDGTPPAKIIEDAVVYARRSVPDAIAALSAPDSVLRKLAEAKMMEAMGRVFGNVAMPA